MTQPRLYLDTLSAMPSARAGRASHRANPCCLGLSVGIAIALAGCESSPLDKQKNDAGKPYSILIDQRGCRWRMVLDTIDRVYPEVQQDGAQACPGASETAAGGDKDVIAPVARSAR